MTAQICVQISVISGGVPHESLLWKTEEDGVSMNFGMKIVQFDK